MSPQFRATTKNTTSKIANGDGPSCNPCSVAMSVAELAKAADMSFALHKIESESSAEGWTPANPLLTQDSSCQPHASSARKRSCTQIHPKTQPNPSFRHMDLPSSPESLPTSLRHRMRQALLTPTLANRTTKRAEPCPPP